MLESLINKKSFPSIVRQQKFVSPATNQTNSSICKPTAQTAKIKQMRKKFKAAANCEQNEGIIHEPEPYRPVELQDDRREAGIHRCSCN